MLGGSLEQAEPTGDSEVGPVDVEPLDAPQFSPAESERIAERIARRMR